MALADVLSLRGTTLSRLVGCTLMLQRSVNIFAISKTEGID